LFLIRRSYTGRDFYRKDDRKIDDKRTVDNASPSTASSEREPRLWDAGKPANRKIIVSVQLLSLKLTNKL